MYVPVCPDLSDVAGRYLLAVGRGRIEIVSILVRSHYAGRYVIKSINAWRTYRRLVRSHSPHTEQGSHRRMNIP